VGYIVVTGGLALLAGLYLVVLRGETALMLMGAGAFFVLFYTFPLKYIGMGEPAVLAVWGPLMVGGGYFVITGEWSNDVAIASVAYALAPTAVLFGKHIDKADVDVQKGIYTAPVLLGDKASRMTVKIMLVAQYLTIFYLIGTGYFSWAMLVVLLALPALKRVFSVYSEPRPTEPPPEAKGVWPLWFVGVTFWYTRRFGGLFLLGLVADVIITRL
jgi:1,4-dihydroxy-2-naphthoate octaprenyltransferase